MHVMRLLLFLLFVVSRLKTHQFLLFVTYQVEMYERGATEEGGAAGERRDADAEQGREEEKELQEQQAEQEVKQEEGVENEADVNGFSGGTEECYRYNHGAADEVDVDDHDGDDEDEEDEEDGDAEEVLTVDDAIDSIGELLLNVISFSSNLSARFLSVSPPVLSPLTHSLPLPLLPPQPPPGFGPYQLFLVCYTGLAWLADAMEMILLSFVGPAARCEFGLSAAEESLIASVVFLGVFLGSYMWGLMADAYGRRRGFMATALFTLFAGLLSAWSPTFLTLLVSRCLVGFGIGGASVVFSLCSEFLPSLSRGFWLVFIEFFWTIGSLIEAALAWAVMPSLHWSALLLFYPSVYPSLLLLAPLCHCLLSPTPPYPSLPLPAPLPPPLPFLPIPSPPWPSHLLPPPSQGSYAPLSYALCSPAAALPVPSPVKGHTLFPSLPPSLSSFSTLPPSRLDSLPPCLSSCLHPKPFASISGRWCSYPLRPLLSCCCSTPFFPSRPGFSCSKATRQQHT
ncbi:unnamed protein product [Closterium sp. NIES-53]